MCDVWPEVAAVCGGDCVSHDVHNVTRITPVGRCTFGRVAIQSTCNISL